MRSRLRLSFLGQVDMVDGEFPASVRDCGSRAVRPLPPSLTHCFTRITPRASVLFLQCEVTAPGI
jgi:hypothetical protein